jgi:hypothetical protein
MMVALELMRGLKKLDIPYRFNDFNYIKKHPNEIACIIGKPQILDEIKWKNPIIFGAGVFSHPVDNLALLEKYPTIKKVLVPGPWMRDAFVDVYGEELVDFWPVGIDTEKWNPAIKRQSDIDFLIYDKIRWDHELYEKELLNPIKLILSDRNFSYETITYGQYDHSDLIEKLSRSRATIFLCEHETQGLAYQQILSTDIPILAWDRGGFWQDPTYYPHRVQFAPVSSVPYWNDLCGVKFEGKTDFSAALDEFCYKLNSGHFSPRSYIEENLTLEKCALRYVEIHEDLRRQ